MLSLRPGSRRLFGRPKHGGARRRSPPTVWLIRQIGDAFLTVQNDANGTIDANVGDQTLLVAPDGLFVNDGVAEATSGGILQIGQSGANSWTNNGTIQADWGEIIANGPFVNNGSITVTDGGLDLIGPFQNDGTISVSDGQLYLGGEVSLAEAETVQLDGNSAVTINGTLALNGLTLDTRQVKLSVDGGTIEGGNGRRRLRRHDRLLRSPRRRSCPARRRSRWRLRCSRRRHGSEFHQR